MSDQLRGLPPALPGAAFFDRISLRRCSSPRWTRCARGGSRCCSSHPSDCSTKGSSQTCDASPAVCPAPWCARRTACRSGRTTRPAYHPRPHPSLASAPGRSRARTHRDGHRAKEASLRAQLDIPREGTFRKRRHSTQPRALVYARPGELQGGDAVAPAAARTAARRGLGHRVHRVSEPGGDGGELSSDARGQREGVSRRTGTRGSREDPGAILRRVRTRRGGHRRVRHGTR